MQSLSRRVHIPLLLAVPQPQIRRMLSSETRQERPEKLLLKHQMARIRATIHCVQPYHHPATPLERTATLELLTRRDAGTCKAWVLVLSALVVVLPRLAYSPDLFLVLQCAQWAG